MYVFSGLVIYASILFWNEWKVAFENIEDQPQLKKLVVVNEKCN
jgi:hypothetical protein